MERDGPNELEKPPKPTLLLLFLMQCLWPRKSGRVDSGFDLEAPRYIYIYDPYIYIYIQYFFFFWGGGGFVGGAWFKTALKGSLSKETLLYLVFAALQGPSWPWVKG